MRNWIIVMMAFGCGKSGGGGGPGGSDHWKSWPIETVKGTVHDVAYTIDLPKGMRMTDDNGTGEIEYDVHQNDRTYTPDITISWSAHASTLESYLDVQTGTFLRKENVGSGFITAGENDAYPGKQDYLVHAEVPAANGAALDCDARVTPFAQGDNVKDDLLPLVEKMCLSLKPQG